MTATNVFLDLLSSDPDSGYHESLREEASAAFQQETDWADPAALAKLQYTDSAIRESLRLSPVLTRVVLREVVKKGGIELPDGHHVPNGAWLGAPVVGIHHDERFYPDSEKYEPFRFATAAKSPPSGGTVENIQTEKASQNRNLQGVSTASDTYLAFGYGRHSW